MAPAVFAIGRIEGNSCSSNGIGYDIDGQSLLIGNSAHANATSFIVQLGTSEGPIVGMTAGGTITSTSPWANFVTESAPRCGNL